MIRYDTHPCAFVGEERKSLYHSSTRKVWSLRLQSGGHSRVRVLDGELACLCCPRETGLLFFGICILPACVQRAHKTSAVFPPWGERGRGFRIDGRPLPTLCWWRRGLASSKELTANIRALLGVPTSIAVVYTMREHQTSSSIVLVVWDTGPHRHGKQHQAWTKNSVCGCITRTQLACVGVIITAIRYPPLLIGNSIWEYTCP